MRLSVGAIDSAMSAVARVSDAGVGGVGGGDGAGTRICVASSNATRTLPCWSEKLTVR